MLKDGRSAQPPKPKPKRTRGAVPTGTPRGWTFWQTTETCWRLFLLKHVMMLFPVVVKDPLIIGTIYHALLDNWAPEAIAGWGPEYAKHLALGVKLYEAREKGPPLPKATASEKQHTLDFGMTSKPDREELGFGKVPIIRDFKSTAHFSDNDAQSWATNGGIIGEALAVGASKAIVDVICKSPGDSFGRVQQFEVEVGDAEREALEQTVADARSEIRMRLDEALEAGNQKALRATFPKRLSSCVGRYGVCDYYERCWGTGPEKHLFEEKSKGHRWVGDEADGKQLGIDVKKVKEKFAGVV